MLLGDPSSREATGRGFIVRQFTLKVVLFFAQFEREVTVQRVCDEIAASKKGVWTVGVSPAGDHCLAKSGSSSLVDILVTLEHLDHSSVQIRWRELVGRNAPALLWADLLRRAMALPLSTR